MMNPFGPKQESGSYMDLHKRMLQHVRAMKVNDQIFKVVQNAYEHALITENVVLSRAEKNRMLSQIMKLVLEDMIKKLNEGSSSA